MENQVKEHRGFPTRKKTQVALEQTATGVRCFGNAAHEALSIDLEGGQPPSFISRYSYKILQDTRGNARSLEWLRVRPRRGCNASCHVHTNMHHSRDRRIDDESYGHVAAISTLPGHHHGKTAKGQACSSAWVAIRHEEPPRLGQEVERGHRPIRSLSAPRGHYRASVA